MSGAGGSDRAGLLARIRAALRSVNGNEGDESGDTLPATAFSEVPESAFTTLASRLDGTAGNGAPIADLFADAGDDAANRAAVVMLNGLSQGPLAIVTQLAQVLGMSQNRAEVIARNELVGSYRDAQMANYRVNSDVIGSWMWSAAIASACIMCVEMDGTIHSMDEDLLDHVCGRCEPLPITRSWSDIMSPYGLSAEGIPETSITESYGTGHDWFMSQGADVQRGILGPAKYEAWSRGDISLNDLMGVHEDGTWGNSLYERSLKEMGLDAHDYLPSAPPRGLGARGRQAIEEARMRQAALENVRQHAGSTGLGPRGVQAVEDARAAIPEPEMIRVDLGDGMFTYVDPYENPFDVKPNMAGRDTGWQNINDVMAKLRGQKTTGELELREPMAAKTVTSYTKDDLAGKTMAELRQIAHDAGVTPARSKAETIQRILDKQHGVTAPGARVAALRRQLDEKLAEREVLYGKQHDLLEEQAKLEKRPLERSNATHGIRQHVVGWQ